MLLTPYPTSRVQEGASLVPKMQAAARKFAIRQMLRTRKQWVEQRRSMHHQASQTLSRHRLKGKLPLTASDGGLV